MNPSAPTRRVGATVLAADGSRLRAAGRRVATLLVWLACVWTIGAAAAAPAERSRILDAARARAAVLAGQPVRIKVDRLNVDRGWAVVVGEIVAASGRPVDWSLASECDANLDKMLWVVLHKARGRWRIEHIDICASEPPYWYPELYGGLVWPCGVYAGLDDGNEETLESRCRQRKSP